MLQEWVSWQQVWIRLSLVRRVGPWTDESIAVRNWLGHQAFSRSWSDLYETIQRHSRSLDATAEGSSILPSLWQLMDWAAGWGETFPIVSLSTASFRVWCHAAVEIASQRWGVWVCLPIHWQYVLFFQVNIKVIVCIWCKQCSTEGMNSMVRFCRQWQYCCIYCINRHTDTHSC